jgi:N-carbamoyl-L-amino-acid hydrolase
MGETRMTISPEIDKARDVFDLLRQHSADPPGITRTSYGDGENFAHKTIAEWAADLSLNIQHDYAGNQYVTLPGRDRSAPRVIMGSHMDSVRHGGNFDGAAGVVCAMSALHRLHRLNRKPQRDLTVMAIRAEEIVWFPCHYAGSRMAFGLLEPKEYDEIRRSDSGRSFAEHIDELGFDSAALKAGKAFLNPEEIHCYIEVHIEQGPVLLNAGLPLGVVTGIRGNLRYRNCHVDGAYSHAGGVPREFRRDALFAFVEFAHYVETYCLGLESRGVDIVFTVGEAYTDAENHAITKVPGRVDFTMDIRSIDNQTLLKMDEDLRAEADRISAKRSVAIDLGPVANAKPAIMDEGIRTGFRRQLEALSIPTMDIGSGGGHDCAVFAGQGVKSAMLFIRNDGGSHNPEEAMDMDDFEKAAVVLSDFLIDEFCSRDG